VFSIHGNPRSGDVIRHGSPDMTSHPHAPPCRATTQAECDTATLAVVAQPVLSVRCRSCRIVNAYWCFRRDHHYGDQTLGALLIVGVTGVVFDGGAPIALTLGTFDFPRGAFD
jgi:hypothetical protein